MEFKGPVKPDATQSHRAVSPRADEQQAKRTACWGVGSLRFLGPDPTRSSIHCFSNVPEPFGPTLRLRQAA
jgi:hypothetical protein